MCKHIAELHSSATDDATVALYVSAANVQEAQWWWKPWGMPGKAT
jgi:hypothetical protein